MRQPYENLNVLGTFASRFLDADGDGTGSIDMNVDGSSTPVDFKITAQAGEQLILHRLMVSYTDTGSIDAAGYGNGPALTNGMQFIYSDPDDVETDFTAQLPIKTNMQYGAYCYDVEVHAWGNGDEMFLARYSMFKDGSPLMLTPGASFLVRTNDNLTVLTSKYVRIGMVSVPIL